MISGTRPSLKHKYRNADKKASPYRSSYTDHTVLRHKSRHITIASNKLSIFSMPIPVALLDQSYKIIAVSDNFKDIFEIGDDMGQRSILDLITSESAERFSLAIAASGDMERPTPFSCSVTVGDRPIFTVGMIKKTGNRFYCLLFPYNEFITNDIYRMTETGRMIRAIAHQWKQPLSSLSMMVQDIAQYDRKFSEISMGLINYMSETVTDFLNFLNLDKKSIFDVKECVPFVMRIMMPIINKTRINCKATCICNKELFDQRNQYAQTCDTHHIKVYGKKNEFQQVLLTLLSNAAEAVSERDEKNISISMALVSNTIEVSIKDSGGGIRSSIIDKIFEPHFTTKAENNGTGIGLFLAKQIIENHFRGQISAFNQDNGAIFKLKIPLAESVNL